MWQELPGNLKGLEFDWFALDRDGRIGLFASFGEGWIPAGVAGNTNAHIAISDSLEAPHWGSEAVWKDYAKQGLFVFDWGKSGTSYRKVASPTATPDPALVSRLSSIQGLPNLSLSFAETAEISNDSDY